MFINIGMDFKYLNKYPYKLSHLLRIEEEMAFDLIRLLDLILGPWLTFLSAY